MNQYWTYPCTGLREAWFALLCIWRMSRIYRTLFYFSRGERWIRYHSARADALGCAVYCCTHECDMNDCKDAHD